MRNTCLNNKIKELFDKRKRKIALLYSYNTKNILNERQLKIRELSLFLLFKLKIVYLYVSGEVDDIVTAVNLCLDKQYTKEDFDIALQINYKIYRNISMTFFFISFFFLSEGAQMTSTPWWWPVSILVSLVSGFFSMFFIFEKI